MKIVIAISGASGAIIGIKLLEVLKRKGYLIISKNARKIIEYETSYSLSEIEKMAKKVYDNRDLTADISSGTNKFDALVIVPCSISTLSKIANGIADNLITRVAAVALKERRKLIAVPRETPLSTISLKNMYELSKMGAIILPVSPPFYIKPTKIEDIVNYMVGKILDLLGVENDLYPVYRPE